MRAGRVLALVACRDLAGPWLPEGVRRLLTGDETLRITLSGLNAADLAELSAHLPEHACDRAPGGPGAAPGPRPGARDTVDTAASDVLPGAPGARGLTEPAAARLRDHTLGNPLHARALLATVPVRVLADREVRLPAPGTYALPFARRLHACTPAAGRLVAACAVLDGSCPLHVAAAVAGGLDEPLEALEEAVNAGLLRELPGRLVGFPEPLARAAAYDGLGAGVRARLHLAAARVVDDIGTALRHRAAAAAGPDEALAEELASFAAKAAQHGQWHEAAAHLDLAAGSRSRPRAGTSCLRQRWNTSSSGAMCSAPPSSPPRATPIPARRASTCWGDSRWPRDASKRRPSCWPRRGGTGSPGSPPTWPSSSRGCTWSRGTETRRRAGPAWRSSSP
ncbi:hypothetical protein [Nonomuraea sp. B19D2]|uniref:hypothetical protein n=1 Tax=Nonomuraea sp. B19D2 TaxID=3159561 RepID=UPI0032DB6A85